jgi:serine/threonine-protein kinase
MAGMADGLCHLHANNVIMRQLSPSNIILTHRDHSPIIADFEMAKLLDRRPTVSPTDSWPEDAYRAPEVGGPNNPTATADVYSWARVFIHSLTGSRPPRAGDDVAELDSHGLSKRLRNLLRKCLQLDPQRRPNTMQIIRDCLNRC